MPTLLTFDEQHKRFAIRDCEGAALNEEALEQRRSGVLM